MTGTTVAVAEEQRVRERRRVAREAADRRFCLPEDQMDRECNRRAKLALTLNAELGDDA